MDEDQQFCLRWNNHQSTLISVFDTLLEKETLVDCTLAAEGQFLKAHKVVLSACSPYFAALLSQQYDKHPIFILKDVKFQELRAMMDYMYRGEVNISQDQLAALLKAAESLQIKGLSDSSGGRSGNNGTQSAHAKDTSAANKNASSKGSGLTIEQKMPRLAASASEVDADMSEAHEGSASPNARKRKKVRRRSIETNNVDNHDHSNSSSHSMPHGGAAATQQQSQAPPQATPTTLTSATSSANVLSVTKKTDQELKSDGGDENEDQHRPAKEVPQRQNNGGRKSISSAAPTAKTTTGSVTHKDGQQDLIEPKNEYDESNEETVEDLTLDEEEMMEEMEQAGPSHGGEGSSQGYPQWPVDRSQDNEAFMSGQDATGHHRDAQDDAVEADDVGTYTIYEVDVYDDSTPGGACILENDNIVVTLNQDKVNLVNWNELNTRKLSNVDWIKKGEVDIIRCAKTKTKRTRSIPVGGTPAISTTILNEQLAAKVPVITGTAVGQVNNGGVAKKTTKNHPRIKYSIKHPPGAGQITAHSMATLVSSIQNSQLVVHNPTAKSELLNFTMSRKFGNRIVTGSEIETKTEVTTLYPAGTISTLKGDVIPKYVIQEQSESKVSGATITNEELQTSIMSELSNYEIDEIELNPYASSTVESIDREGSQSGTMYRMASEEDNIKMEDSPDGKYAYQLNESDDPSKNFECRHCGKKYRWKSTLRRHENVECGGKEPAHQCPHCNYKAKQRGNLGVHIRKHHSALPQLESRRKSRP